MSHHFHACGKWWNGQVIVNLSIKVCTIEWMFNHSFYHTFGLTAHLYISFSLLERWVMSHPIINSQPKAVTVDGWLRFRKLQQITRWQPTAEKERCSGSYCQAVGFLVIKDDSISAAFGLEDDSSLHTIDRQVNRNCCRIILHYPRHLTHLMWCRGQCPLPWVHNSWNHSGRMTFECRCGGHIFMKSIHP